jgi:hypothetical protein
VDDAVYESAESVAAKWNTSLSALVGEYLAGLGRATQAPKPEPQSESEEERDRREREKLVRLFREANLVLGYKPTREKTDEP